MFERFLRLLVGGGMLVILFLPWNPEGWPNLLYVLWVSLGVLSGIMGEPTVSNFVGGFSLLLLLQAIPLLILLNLCLCIYPSVRLRALYRIILMILLLVTWYRSLRIDFQWPEMGIFWASPFVVSIASLVEFSFVAKEQRRKSEVAS